MLDSSLDAKRRRAVRLSRQEVGIGAAARFLHDERFIEHCSKDSLARRASRNHLIQHRRTGPSAVIHKNPFPSRRPSPFREIESNLSRDLRSPRRDRLLDPVTPLVPLRGSHPRGMYRVCGGDIIYVAPVYVYHHNAVRVARSTMLHLGDDSKG